MDKLKSLIRVEENFNKFPSVGKKSAERMAYAILDMSKEDVEELYNSIKDMKEKVHSCPICGFLSESEVCPICGDPSRDTSKLVVVSYPRDVLAFENSESFDGHYHQVGNCPFGAVTSAERDFVALTNAHGLEIVSQSGSLFGHLLEGIIIGSVVVRQCGFVPIFRKNFVIMCK